MKKLHLMTLKNVLEKSKTDFLPDDRIVPFILTQQELTKKAEEEQAFLKELQKRCGLKISESGQLDETTKQEDIDKFNKLYKERNDQDMTVDPIFNEKQVIEFSKENKLVGIEMRIVYETLLRKEVTTAEPEKKLKKS